MLKKHLKIKLISSAGVKTTNTTQHIFFLKMAKTILSCDMNVSRSRLSLHYSPLNHKWSNTQHGVLGGSNKSLMLDMLMPVAITYYSSVLFAGWSKKKPHSHCVSIISVYDVILGLDQIGFYWRMLRKSFDRAHVCNMECSTCLKCRLCGVFWQLHRASPWPLYW